ncbi:Vault protein inter-alpha-trypsin domain protein [Pelomyxa schiedti]|nr:Vault protein inter-alpha-trypsin domain protein [Pelomyxa schiedti]
MWRRRLSWWNTSYDGSTPQQPDMNFVELEKDTSKTSADLANADTPVEAKIEPSPEEQAARPSPPQNAPRPGMKAAPKHLTKYIGHLLSANDRSFLNAETQHEIQNKSFFSDGQYYQQQQQQQRGLQRRPDDTSSNVIVDREGKMVKENIKINLEGRLWVTNSALEINEETTGLRKLNLGFMLPWQSKEEYDESGPSIVHRKCFGGGYAESPYGAGGVAFSTPEVKQEPRIDVTPSRSRGEEALPSSESTSVPDSKPVEQKLAPPEPSKPDHPRTEGNAEAPTITPALPVQPQAGESLVAPLIPVQALSMIPVISLHPRFQELSLQQPQTGSIHSTSLVALPRKPALPAISAAFKFSPASPSYITQLSRLLYCPEDTFSEEFRKFAGLPSEHITEEKYSSLCLQAGIVLASGSTKLKKQMALCALSNVSEVFIHTKPSTVRLMCKILLQMGCLRTAIFLLEEILKSRPEEPQSYLDLACALTYVDTIDSLKRALELLNEVLKRHWDIRFEQVELVAIMELNSILAEAESQGLLPQLRPNFDARIISPLGVDLRCVLTWDTNLADVDLIITEPSGETCYSFNNHTRFGGLLSRNFTGGYGPTEYLIKKAPPGPYNVQVKLHHTPNDKGVVVCNVIIYSNFCRPGIQCTLANSTLFLTPAAPTAVAGTIIVSAP